MTAPHPDINFSHSYADLKLCMTLLDKELMERYDFTQKDVSRFLRFIQVLGTGNGNVSKDLFKVLLGVAVRHHFVIKRGEIEPLADEKDIGGKNGLFKIPPGSYSWTRDRAAEENTCLGLRKSDSLTSLLEVLGEPRKFALETVHLAHCVQMAMWGIAVIMAAQSTITPNNARWALRFFHRLGVFRPAQVRFPFPFPHTHTRLFSQHT